MAPDFACQTAPALDAHISPAYFAAVSDQELKALIAGLAKAQAEGHAKTEET
jgi:hypothetical protein